jgi:inner membrane transporter RhtA
LWWPPLGLAFAFANCALFMLYIALGHRIAADGGSDGIDRLTAAMLIAFVVVTPIGAAQALPAFSSLALLGAGVAVGVCSSVIPYVCDQLAMARLARATFALLLALLPAVATIVGVVVLGQIPTLGEALGVGLVIAGVALHRTR